MSIESVMLSNYHASAAPSPSAFSLSQHQALDIIFSFMGPRVFLATVQLCCCSKEEKQNCTILESSHG